jgi:hypothetical protein
MGKHVDTDALPLAQLPIFGVFGVSGRIVVNKRDRHENHRADQGRKEQETPRRLRQKNNHRIGACGRMHGTSEHHERNSRSHRQSN